MVLLYNFITFRYKFLYQIGILHSECVLMLMTSISVPLNHEHRDSALYVRPTQSRTSRLLFMSVPVNHEHRDCCSCPSYLITNIEILLFMYVPHNHEHQHCYLCPSHLITNIEAASYTMGIEFLWRGKAAGAWR